MNFENHWSLAKFTIQILTLSHNIYVTGFTKTVLIGTRNEIQFIADY